MVSSYEIELELNKITNSLKLYELAEHILKRHSEFWLIGKRSEIFTFDICQICPVKVIDDVNLHTFINETDILFTCYNVLTEKKTLSHQKSNIEKFYDHFARYGRFFYNKRQAIKFLYYKKILRKCELPPEAQKYIDQYPEYFI